MIRETVHPSSFSSAQTTSMSQSCEDETVQTFHLNYVKKIKDLEDENAKLQCRISELETKCLDTSDGFQSENKLLQDIVNLHRDKMRGIKQNNIRYSANIQKFVLTSSTYSPKCYR